MKNLIYLKSLFFSLIAVTLVSCNKINSTEELLIGRWDVIFEKETTYQNDVISDEDSWSNPKGDFVLEFYSNGTGKFFEQDIESSSFTWELINDNKISVMMNSQGPYDVEIQVDKNSLSWMLILEVDIPGIKFKKTYYKECTRAD